MDGSLYMSKSNKLLLIGFKVKLFTIEKKPNYIFHAENCRRRYNVDVKWCTETYARHTSRVERPLKEFKLIKKQHFFAQFNFHRSFVYSIF